MLQLTLQTVTMTLTLNQMQNQLIQMQLPEQPVQKQFAMHKMHLQLLMKPLNKLTRTLMETVMQKRILIPAAWELPAVLKPSRMPEIRASVQLVCQDQT